MDRLRDYDYELPQDLVAQTPLADRAASKLLVLDRLSGDRQHRNFRDVRTILQPGDLLVLNDTRVTALRLQGARNSGGKVELLLLEPEANGRFLALAKPAKRLKPGAEIEFDEGLRAKVLEDLGEGRMRVQFSESENIEEVLSRIGTIPLPPYIRKPISDPERYQTVYAQSSGSSAAPTAGLHFTSELLQALAEVGVQTAWVSLEVGLDTFRPVQADRLSEHRMHGERCQVPEATAKAVAACRGRVVAVGTTAVRTLESFAAGPRTLNVGSQVTRLFIRPGFEFQVVDGMFTNFHMPRTTMLMLVSALCGRHHLLAAYAEAIRQRYRFLSFGDSMLIL